MSFLIQDKIEAVFEKIEKKDSQIKAFLSLNKEGALEEAKRIDEAKEQNEFSLRGRAIAVKDNICVKDLPLTCGSQILKNYLAPYDATVIKRIKRAGMIMVGKTNLDEFAMGSSTENSAFQITRNPWNIKRVPGGSSGGSAAAVASGMVEYALGSDTGGSIRQPASFCGVVGLKPTYGRVSRYGLVAMASSLDQVGPLTQTVEQSAQLLQIIAGADEEDLTTAKRPVVDFVKELSHSPQDLKCGIPQEYFQDEGLEKDVKERVEEAIKEIEKWGVRMYEVSLSATDYALACYYIIVPAEVSSNLARFDGIRYGMKSKQAKSLLETYCKTRGEFLGTECKRRIMLGTFVLSHGYAQAYYKRARKVELLVKRDFEEIFKEVDCLLTPTSPTPAFKIGEKSGDPLAMYMADVFTVPANIAGLPAMSVPCGLVRREGKDLPVGLQIIAPWWREDLVLRLGYWYERSSGQFNPPSFIGGKD